MSEMKLVLSHSQISKLNCGRKFELAYIEGLVRKEGLHSRRRNFGTAFHAGMQAVLTFLHESPHLYTAEEAVYVARRSVETKLNTIAKDNKETADIEYIEMLGQLKHEVGVLLEWFIPVSGLGTTLHPVTLYDLFGTTLDCEECDGTGGILEPCFSCVDYGLRGQVPDTTPIIEWSFDYSLNDTVNLRGSVDAVLYDEELDEFILVDWKTRANIGDATMSMLDAQLQLYAYVIEAMCEKRGGGGINKARMWEIRTKPPAPAKINKNGTPSVASSGAASTTREAWLASLNEKQLAKYGDDEEFINRVGSIRPLEYFARETDEYVTESMRELTFQNIVAQAEQIAYWHSRHEEGKDLPAILTSFGCRGCDFLQLCANPFHNGTDATDMIELEYERKEGYQPDVSDTDE